MVNKNKFFSGIAVVLLIGAAVLLALYLAQSKAVERNNCNVKIEYREVNGNSLTPLAKDRDKVKIAKGYYECRKVSRGDLVIYNYAGNDNSLIKIVKAVSGDKFKLKKNGNDWNIIINGEKLTTSRGEPYRISGNKKEMLSLYQGLSRIAQRNLSGIGEQALGNHGQHQVRVNSKEGFNSQSN